MSRTSCRSYGARGRGSTILAAGMVLAFAATAAPAPFPRPFVQGPVGAAPPNPQNAFEYAAKIVCGAQEDPKDMRLARGFYATTINVHNPNPEVVVFFKKLALSIPPGEQKPGEVIPIAFDKLEYDQALAADCEDIKRRVFGGSLPGPFIEGFVVIQSPRSLDVTAVYSTATVRDGVADENSSIHVEQIRERPPRLAGLPDLTVQDISIQSVSCPGGGGTCVTTAKVTIANLNAAAAGPFTTKTVFDPGQSIGVGSSFPGGLAGGTSQSFTVTTPPGGNCFDPDCTICVTVDDANTVGESNEANNQLCKTTLG